MKDDQEMNISIWEMTVSIWDILSLCTSPASRQSTCSSANAVRFTFFSDDLSSGVATALPKRRVSHSFAWLRSLSIFQVSKRRSAPVCHVSTMYYNARSLETRVLNTCELDARVRGRL